MAQSGNDGADEDSIRPVSSLLSHFENLGHVQPSTNASRENLATHLKTPETGGDGPGYSRASLDIPRSESPWHQQQQHSRASSTVRPQFTGTSPTGPGDRGERNGSRSPGRRTRAARPQSMSVQAMSPPGSTPMLTVESPRSPPRNLGAPREHSFGGGLRAGHDRSISTSVTPHVSPEQHHHGRPQVRPTTPLYDSSGVISPGSRRGKTNGDTNSSKSSSVPPPVNRAEKPKVPLKKPSMVAETDTSANTLAPSQRTSFEDSSVSPFNTPPSSPEKPSPPSGATDRTSKRIIPPPSFGVDVSKRRSQIEVSEPPEAKEPEILVKPKRTSTAPNLRAKPPPPPPPMKRSVGPKKKTQDTHEPPTAGTDLSDMPEKRPGLPPRSQAAQEREPAQPVLVTRTARGRADFEPPARHSLDIPRPSRQTKQPLQIPSADQRINFPPPPRRDAAAIVGRVPSESPTGAASIMSRSLESNHTSPAPVQRSIARAFREESEDSSEQLPEEPLPSRTDYPDFSHTNRRPPRFRSGTRGIHTKHDTRVFDVCGQFAVTTGYFTRVWDLVTGEQLMSLSHGENMKGLSVAFKPGNSMDDEGKFLWLGTNIGEIHEIEIATQSIVSSRTSPSRREVIKIYRRKKELWTLDDEGRLLLWPPDESGAPNLQYTYSNSYDRVAKGHTFSMVVGDHLWHATGKEVRIYQPGTKDSNFQVLKSPLGRNHTSDVTCGAATSKYGGRVYLGHADGKVTIYSSKDYSLIGTVNVSVYKISCLLMVGDYLWAAYKTGMIYVYDVTTTPWTVKKDWLAHDQAVCGLILDPSALWTVNKLQVVSLGMDNYIRLWDGMLEEDWLESTMQSRDVEYCQFREISAVVVTWNAGATVPGNLRDSSFIRDAIHPENPPELIVFGFQELVDLEDKKITAKSLLKGSSKKRDHTDKEHMSRQYRIWKDHLAACIHEYMPIDQPYVLLHTANLIGLFTCVFIKQSERQKVRNVSAAEVKRGMGGLHGNKGALILRFVMDDSSFCLINCHLAAGQTHTAHRNNDIAAILESDSLPMEPSSSARIDTFVGGGDGSMILDHEICVLNGDLNYRIDSMPRHTVIEAVKARNLPKLLDRDQLLASRRKNPGFRLRTFNEAPITFAPTYKYDIGTDEYDSSEKKRSPAWCDRVLYRGVGRIKQTEYRRHEIRVSDHRPVSASFKIRIKTISPKKRVEVWEACQREFAEEKRRLATESSINYLVDVLGLNHREAKELITQSI